MKKYYSGKQVTNTGTICGLPQKEPTWKKNSTPRQYKRQNPKHRIDVQMQNKSTAKPYFKKVKNVLHSQDPGCDSMSGIDLPISPAESTLLTEDLSTLLFKDAINKENSIYEHQQSTGLLKDIFVCLPKVSVLASQQIEINEKDFGSNKQKGHTKMNTNIATDLQLSPVLPNSPFFTGVQQLEDISQDQECHKISGDIIIFVVNDTEQLEDQECNNCLSENSVSMDFGVKRKYNKLKNFNLEDKVQNSVIRKDSLLNDVKETHETDSNFMCMKCNKIYKSRASLRIHGRKTCKGIGKWYLCTRCDSQFKKRGAPSMHIKTVGRPKPRLKKSSKICEYCGKQYNDRSSLLQHLEYHRNLKPHKCPDCGKVFNKPSNLNVHVKFVHKKEKSWFYCSCGIRSLSKERTMAHVQTHNIPEGAETPMPFTCNYCGKPCISQRVLTIHQNKTHKEKSCKECGEVCSSLSQLIKHKSNVHGVKCLNTDVKKIYEKYKGQSCPICDKMLASVRSLNHHLEAIHNFRIPCSGERIKCGRCHKVYTTYGSYVSHTKKHHKEEVTESELQSLAEHLSVEDESEMSSKAHACNYCNKKFSTAEKLQNHGYRMHSLPNPNLVCNVCDMQFETQAKYCNHKYSAHVSVEERTCQTCKKVFPDKKRLYNHKVMHAKTFYLCSECGSNYKRCGDYRRHMRDKHGLNSS